MSLSMQSFSPVVVVIVLLVVVIVLIVIVIVVVVVVIVVVAVTPHRWYVAIARYDQNPFAQPHHRHAEAIRIHCPYEYRQFSLLRHRQPLLNVDLRR